MFLPTGQARSGNEYPADGTLCEQDWHVLAAFWHPVAFEHEIGDAPLAARLLDVDLAIYRTSSRITVASENQWPEGLPGFRENP